MSTTLIITLATMAVFLGLGLLVAEILTRRPSRRREQGLLNEERGDGDRVTASGSEEVPC